ncbi:leukocyte elastase inhibitor-like [Engraulis encrasicolus]|uniref:leukocyte elastase inhibitor-like n=1 Tax=Engraulis encrasicolus TaxID=184585 RepID=UPI002FD5C6D1
MELSHANGEFALDVFRALCKESEGPRPSSLIISPLSISTALAMVYLGARNKTQEEMGKVLKFGQVSDVHSHFNSLMEKITAPSSYTLNLANRLFGQQSFNFSQEFLGEVQKKYLADLQAMDFVSATEAARGTINTWVEDKTENKIKELLKAGVLTPMTRLVLVNAVYFKGNWMHRFKPENTKEKPFKITKTETRPVQMMHQKQKLPHNWVREPNLQVVELPYTDPQLSMAILLPPEDTLDTITSLAEELNIFFARFEVQPPDTAIHNTPGYSSHSLVLEEQQVMSKLTISKLLEWTDPSNLRRQNVHLHLPRFKLESSASLAGTLTVLGMGSLFDCSSADLTGISVDRGLSLSALAHGVVCEVNEVGTEAAAATVDICMTVSIDRTLIFMADHPFLFLIMHKPTRSILFLGSYCGPE